MGVRGQSSNDRLRTIWSSEMDRFFIDLMLEQVSKENRIDDNLFSKWAWMDMMSSFNDRFKYQYELDILKNRHKVLRRVYRAVKELLDQKGFSWDNDRHMVKADNRVWDNYVKVHPDARSYRVKTIPYYKDLCVIYRNATVPGKLIPSDRNVNVDGSVPGSEVGKLSGFESPDEHSSNSGENTNSAITPTISVGEGSVGATHEITTEEDNGNSDFKASDSVTHQSVVDTDSKIIRSRTIWQPPMDRFFINLMLDNVRKGNKKYGIFPKEVWMEMADSFNAKFGFKYDVDILKNRFKCLKRQYKLVKNLLDRNEFSWDEPRQMVMADDSVWQDYIKVHPTARQFMTRPALYYKDLCVICRERTGNKRANHSRCHLDLDVEDLEAAKLITPLQSLRSPDSSDSSKAQVYNGQESHTRRVCGQIDKPSLENPCAKRARGSDEGVASAIRQMTSVVSSLTEKKKDEDDFSAFSVENVVEAIQALPEMDEEFILDACDLLEDEKKAKTFLALDFKLRKKWLLRKLRLQ